VIDIKKQLIIDGIACPYDIYDDGRIYSYYKQGFMKILYNTYKFRKSDGYQKVKICIPNKKARRMSVHRLVAMSFIPNPNNLPQVNHINGNKKDNRVSNLEWVSARDNTLHAITHNLRSNMPGGVNCPNSKYPESVIRRICELISEHKYNAKEIAQMTSTNRRLVSSIANKCTWIDISSEYPGVVPIRTYLGNNFTRFHEWVEHMIIRGSTTSEIISRLRKEGLSTSEAYNLLGGRLRNNDKLKSIYKKNNMNKRESSTTIPLEVKFLNRSRTQVSG
jgi:hypothetical protein